MGQSLKTKIVKGGGWLTLNQLLSQSVRIVISILLTRILMPEDFGLVAKSFAVTGIVEIVFVQGLLGSVVQDNKIKAEQINALFWITLMVSSFLAIIIYLLAGSIALFYEDSRVEWIVQVVSVTIFSSGISLLPLTLIKKELRFEKIFLASIISTVISAGIALYLAQQGYGYKALIYQFLIKNIIHSFLIILTANWIPKLSFCSKSIGAHLRFGLNMMGSNLLNYLVRNSDDIAIGRLQGNDALGLYSRAYFLMTMPYNFVAQIFSSLMFPVFSEIQENRKLVRNLFLKSQHFIVLLTFPIIFLFGSNVKYVIIHLLGHQWVDSILLFKIFIPLLLVQIYTIPISSLLLAFNKTGFLLRYAIVTKPILIGCIVAAAFFSTTYVAIVVLILSSIFTVGLYLLGLKLLKLASIKLLIVESVKHIRELFGYLLVLFLLSVFLPSGIWRLVLSFVVFTLFYLLIFLIQKSEINTFIAKIRKK